MRKVLIILLVCTACGSATETRVKMVGTMRSVMWDGELEGKVMVDSLSSEHLYGLGPLSGLTGEVLVLNGTTYTSTIKDSRLIVQEDPKATAPFFVYSNVDQWKDHSSAFQSLDDLEELLNEIAKDTDRPFPFLIKGRANTIGIHTQNLAPGTSVSSPDEAHQGQENFSFNDVEVELIGFYSREHKGVFTHHTTNMHIHAIDSDRKIMGHVDSVVMDTEGVKLFLPGDMF